jgi:transposase
VIPSTFAVFVCTLAVDLRGSFDRLAALVRAHVGRDPLTQVALYLFLNRARTHVKVLWWDRNGWCLLYKRLERGTAVSQVEIDHRELELLLEGIDLPKTRPRRPPPPRPGGAARSSAALQEGLAPRRDDA